MMKYSALDVVPVFEGENAAQAIEKSAQLAAYLEKEGFERYLVAEHHNLGGTASSSTATVIQYILSKTDSIRVGAGGVMLSNHSPLQVAETYGTLEALYPGRVDLGIGRAPGTDQATASLISRKNYFDPVDFGRDILQIEYFFGPIEEQKVVGAYPGADSNVPIIILGSSLSSAQIAGQLGLMYAFAGHINPRDIKEAIDLYRESFTPSPFLDKPYVMLGFWMFGAETDEKAEELYAPSGRRFLDLIQGKKTSKASESAAPLTSAEKILATRAMGLKVQGSKETLVNQIREIKELYQPDELIGLSQMKNIEDLKNAYRIFKEAVEEVNQDD